MIIILNGSNHELEGTAVSSNELIDLISSQIDKEQIMVSCHLNGQDLLQMDLSVGDQNLPETCNINVQTQPLSDVLDGQKDKILLYIDGIKQHLPGAITQWRSAGQWSNNDIANFMEDFHDMLPTLDLLCHDQAIDFAKDLASWVKAIEDEDTLLAFDLLEYGLMEKLQSIAEALS